VYVRVFVDKEDSFLMMDAIEADFECLSRDHTNQPMLSLEIGCGSGCISAFLAKSLGPSGAYFCTDINPRAVQATHRTAAQNNVNSIYFSLLSAKSLVDKSVSTFNMCV
jgi:release factor glutamine methyltransferase